MRLSARLFVIDGRFFPSTLPRLLPGERVDEPFDHWSRRTSGGAAKKFGA